MSYKLYGWRVSYFTSKLKCYLKYKNILFEEKPMNAFDLYYTAQKKVGARVMPILLTPNNEWLGDTKDIIDELERRFPESKVYPSTPCKRFVSLLLETWADEFWVPHAMHYRWNRPESVLFFENEVSKLLFPYGPRILQNYGVGKVKHTLIGFLPFVGVRPNQYEAIEEWTENMLQILDEHFSKHSYLLGDIPTIGDFGLAGPLVAHLGRDTWPKEHLISKTPNVKKWIENISTLSYKDINITQNTDESDEIPSTLIPILNIISNEFIPMLSQTANLVNDLSKIPKFQTNRPLPRSLEDVTIQMNQHSFSRAGTPFHLWKVQKIIENINNSLSDEEKNQLQSWLHKEENHFKGNDLLHLQFPHLERVGVRVRFQQK